MLLSSLSLNYYKDKNFKWIYKDEVKSYINKFKKERKTMKNYIFSLVTFTVKKKQAGEIYSSDQSLFKSKKL